MVQKYITLYILYVKYQLYMQFIYNAPPTHRQDISGGALHCIDLIEIREGRLGTPIGEMLH